MKEMQLQCDPLPYPLTEKEKELIEEHRKEQCPTGGACREIHLTMPLFREFPDGPAHGCVVCGECIA